MSPVEEIRHAAQLMREPDDIPAHISAWRRKEVQLAVADLLDKVADWMEEGLGKAPDWGNWADMWDDILDATQNIDRAYLGGAS